MYLAGGTVLWVRLEVTAAAAMALADSVHAERGETERAAENATQRGTEDRDRRGSGACAVLPTAPPAARNDITALENGKDVPCPWRRGAESSAGYWSTRASDRATCDTLSRKTVTGVTPQVALAAPACAAPPAPPPPVTGSVRIRERWVCIHRGCVYAPPRVFTGFCVYAPPTAYTQESTNRRSDARPALSRNRHPPRRTETPRYCTPHSVGAFIFGV